MKTLRAVAWMVAMSGCGGPILQDVPAPDPSHVAAVAAGTAAAMAAANPDAASRKREKERRGGEIDMDGEDVVEVVPHDVLDRLDEAETKRR